MIDHKLSGITLIILSLAAMIFTQLIMKSRLSIYGAIPLSPIELVPFIWTLMHDWKIWAGMTSLLLGALFWYAALSRVPLSFAFPIAASSYPIILITSAIFLSESITTEKIIGNLLIVSGVLIAGFSTNT